MYKNKKILGLIPARGGSKRLPGKNIKPLLGKPLIVWTIEQALKSKLIDRVIVSTDDEAIVNISKRAGAQVPFIRPKKLASDTALSIDVALHALDLLQSQDDYYDYIALLEPTSPLRKRNDIDRGIEKLIDNPAANNLVSLGEVHLEHPLLIKKVHNGFVIPFNNPFNFSKAARNKVYFPYGVIYLSKVDALYKNRDFYAKRTIPLFIERWQNYEVDDEIDFLIIEKIMRSLSREFLEEEEQNG